MNKGDLAIEHGDVDGALREYGSAQELFPDNLEMKFWTAISLVNADKVDQALPMFHEIFAIDINWATLVPRLPASGILADDKELINRILSMVPRQGKPPRK
jgi:Flp pilus assembly protein TadD